MFSKNIFEKLLFIIIIIIASKYNILAGIIAIGLYIYFFENKIIENFVLRQRRERDNSPTISNIVHNKNRNSESSVLLNNESSSKHINPIKIYSDNNDQSDENQIENTQIRNIYDVSYVKEKMAKQHQYIIKNTDLDKDEKFRKEYCIDNYLIKNYKQVTDVHNSFPNLKYLSEPCNPCDETCKFDVISTNEQLTMLENLKPINSNTVIVNK